MFVGEGCHARVYFWQGGVYTYVGWLREVYNSLIFYSTNVALHATLIRAIWTFALRDERISTRAHAYSMQTGKRHSSMGGVRNRGGGWGVRSWACHSGGGMAYVCDPTVRFLRLHPPWLHVENSRKFGEAPVMRRECWRCWCLGCSVAGCGWMEKERSRLVVLAVVCKKARES
jgi:hypothetical protein